jgi:hypothetical protein
MKKSNVYKNVASMFNEKNKQKIGKVSIEKLSDIFNQNLSSEEIKKRLLEVSGL